MRGTKAGSWGMLLLAGVMACGPEDEGARPHEEPASPVEQEDTVNGTLLARIQFTPGHDVAFYELAPGELAAEERGGVGIHPPRLERENLAQGSWAELYKRLSGEREAPKALVEADTRRALHNALPSSVVPAELTPPESGRTRAQDLADTVWFLNTFCPDDTDEQFCSTNVAQAAWETQTSLFKTAGANTDDLKGAAFYRYHMGCGDLFCVWTLDSSMTLAPHTYSTWIYSAPGTYRSEVIGKDGNTQVHYAARYNAPWGTFKPAPIETYPFETCHSWTERVNGITHDMSNWYMSTANNIVGPDAWLMKFPVTSNLDTVSSPTLKAGIPQYLWDAGYKHMGGISYSDGKVFVPVHGESGQASKILVYKSSDLSFIAEAAHPSLPNTIPWVAVQPETGMLYTSAFNTDRLLMFRPTWTSDASGTHLQLEYVGYSMLKDAQGNFKSVNSIQGGAFSSWKSHIYLSTNDVSQGILGFDVMTGRQMVQIPVAFDPGAVSDEVQGLTIWDLDGGQAPGISGQVHMILLDQDWLGNDDFSLKHYKVSSLERL